MSIKSAVDNYGKVTETGEGTNVFLAEVTFGNPKNGRKFQLTLKDNTFYIENLKNGETAEYTHKWMSTDGKETKSHSNKSQVTIRDGIVFANKLVKEFFRPEKPVKEPKAKKEKVVKAKKEKVAKAKKEKVVKAKKLKVVEGEEVLPTVAETILDGETNAFIVNGKKFYLEEKDVSGLKGIEVTRAKNGEKIFSSLGSRTVEDLREELALKLAHEWNASKASAAKK